MGNESSWVYAIEEKELQENSANMVFPKGLPVLLIKKAGEIYAISNKCAHMACTLAGGTLQDFIIKCPCHDWRYDVRTGEFLDAKEIKLPVYEWKSSDGKIFIKIQEG
ncbi:MAG: Rieske (2Fe-2S) protein [Candidatus Methanoperedens sp.]|nr:Rieske (2Fe-2S) protein [Candidatus Methanoperedens sp.]